MKKISFGLILIMFLLGLNTTAMAEKPVLIVAADAAFVPFEFVDEFTNEIVGFDVDLVKALGEVMGYEIDFRNFPWDGLIPGLYNRNIDIIASGMTITAERAQQVNFSDPYFVSTLTIVVHENNDDITSFDDLEGKIIAVQISTTGDFAVDDIAGARAARFNTAPEALQNVILGAAHASVIDLPVAEAFLANNPNAPVKHFGPLTADDEFGLAMRKEDVDLLEKVNAALIQIKADGTYDQIYDKWFN